MALHSVAWHSMEYHSMVQHSTAQHGMAQHGTVWHSTTRHGTAQHCMALHTSPPCCLQPHPAAHFCPSPSQPHSHPCTPIPVPLLRLHSLPPVPGIPVSVLGTSQAEPPHLLREGNTEGPRCHLLTTHGPRHLTATSSPTSEMVKSGDFVTFGELGAESPAELIEGRAGAGTAPGAVGTRRHVGAVARGCASGSTVTRTAGPAGSERTGGPASRTRPLSPRR